MQVNNVSSVSFQAHIPRLLIEKLRSQALYSGLRDGELYKQIHNVEKWGYDTSAIGEASKYRDFQGLVLVNNYLAPLKKALLPVKENLLDSFMALTKKDIVDAQNSLKI